MASKFFLVAGLAIIVFGGWVVSLDKGGGDIMPLFGFLIALIGLIVAFWALVGVLRAGNKKSSSGGDSSDGYESEEMRQKNVWQALRQLSVDLHETLGQKWPFLVSIFDPSAAP